VNITESTTDNLSKFVELVDAGRRALSKANATAVDLQLACGKSLCNISNDRRMQLRRPTVAEATSGGKPATTAALLNVTCGCPRLFDWEISEAIASRIDASKPHHLVRSTLQYRIRALQTVRRLAHSECTHQARGAIAVHCSGALSGFRILTWRYRGSGPEELDYSMLARRLQSNHSSSDPLARYNSRRFQLVTPSRVRCRRFFVGAAAEID
jgi:hypothetical protein